MYLNSEETVIFGSEFKLSINVTGIDGLYMRDYNFDIECFTSPANKIIYKKNSFEVKQTDDKNTYIITLDSTKLGVGRLRVKFIAYLPDNAFEDNVRTEIEVVDTGINIIKKR